MPTKEEAEMLRLIEEDVAAPPPVKELPPPLEHASVPMAQTPFLTFVKRLTGADLFCVFGDTGSGKSKLVSQLAMDEQMAGGQVTFFDTEGGFSEEVEAGMRRVGIKFHRVNGNADVRQALRQLKATMVVIDSTTLEITGRWFTGNREEKGRFLLELQNLYYNLKRWCVENRAMAVVTAQPISEFGGKGLQIMGDKANFFLKTALYIDFARSGMVVKKRNLRAFKTRTLPDGSHICKLHPDERGMNFGDIEKDVIATLDTLRAVK